MVSDLAGLPVLIAVVFISTNVLINNENCKSFVPYFQQIMFF